MVLGTGSVSWLMDQPTRLAFPGYPSGILRLSSPNTVARLRWILTTLPGIQSGLRIQLFMAILAQFPKPVNIENGYR